MSLGTGRIYPVKPLNISTGRMTGNPYLADLGRFADNTPRIVELLSDMLHRL